MNTSLSGWIIAATATATAAMIFILDLLIPLGIAVPMWYVIPILLTCLVPGSWITAILTGSTLIMTGLGIVFSEGEFSSSVAADRALASTLQLAIALLVIQYKRSTYQIAEAQQVRDESQLRFRALVERIGDVFWISDPSNHKLVYVSQTFADIWGRNPQDLYDHFETWIEAIHEDDRARVAKDFFENILAGTYDAEYRIMRPDGSIRWIRDRGKPLGVGTLVAGIAEDITERKQAEEALRESEERLQAIMNRAPAAIFIKDRDGRCLFMNDECARVLGLDRTQVKGKTEYELYPAELAKQFRTNDRVVWDSGQGHVLEEHVPQSDNLHTFVSNKFLLRDTNGHPYALCGIATDITERKQAEEALRRAHEELEHRVAERTIELTQSNERLQREITERKQVEATIQRQARLIELSFEPIFVWDLAQGIVEWNRGSEQLYGYSRREVLGQLSHHLLQTRFPVSQAEAEKELLTTGTWRGELRHRTRDKREVIVESRWQLLVIGASRLVLESNRDITKRMSAEVAARQQQRELQRSQAQLQDLTATLFTAQDNERQRIARDLHDDVGQRLAALTIDLQSLSSVPSVLDSTCSHQLTQLGKRTEQIATDLQRLAHDLHPSLLEHAGLEAAVQEHVEEFEARTGLKVTAEVRNLPGTLSIDRATCLYRILQEGLQNVRKHANATHIFIQLLGTTQGVELCIQDDGLGFDVAQEASGEQKGLGLISLHERTWTLHGSFRVKSKRGEGTEVYAWVPLESKQVFKESGTEP